MTLKDYYHSLERPASPKTSFVKKVAARCAMEPATVRLWILGPTKPSNPDHAKILSEMTDIPVDQLWSNESN